MNAPAPEKIADPVATDRAEKKRGLIVPPTLTKRGVQKWIGLRDGDLRKAGKKACREGAEIRVRIVGAYAVVKVVAHDGRADEHKMSIFAYQSFATGYVVEMANRKQIA